MIVGITGGVGSGKSTVLHMLKKEFDAKIYIADEYGHMALMPEYSCYKPIIELFGGEILEKYGQINREKLAEIVYRDDRKLQKLNAIIHPFVWNQIEEDMKKNSGAELHVIESAILIEAGYEEICDKIYAVIASPEVRLKRLAEARGYTEEKSIGIMKKQMSEWELRSRCNGIIENNGDLEDLQRQLTKLFFR